MGMRLEIYDYMVRRAAFEKMEHSLPKQFYLDALRQGCRNFFKVQVDDKGDVLRDDENTEFFKKWKEQK